MGYPDFTTAQDNSSIMTTAVAVASDGCKEIDAVLTDIRTDSVLGNDGTGTASVIDTGSDVVTKYDGTGAITTAGIRIDSAAGAMVIDDLMQKISTKVQVAAQLLSTANSMAKKVMQSLAS